MGEERKREWGRKTIHLLTLLMRNQFDVLIIFLFEAGVSRALLLFVMMLDALKSTVELCT